MSARRWILPAAAGVAGICACVFLASRFLSLPVPSGRYAVGTTLLSAEGLPEHGLQVWYPARPGASGARAPYRLGARGRPELFDLVRTDALLNVEVASGPFPLLVYIPGWGGSRSENTALLQDLASHGYIVAAFDDIYPQPPMDFSTEENAAATIRWANEKLDRLTDIALKTIVEMSRRSDAVPGGAFDHRIDREQIGTIGFSFGGAVAAETAARDSRVKAAVDLDGWLFGSAASSGVPAPFLFVNSATPGRPESTPEGQLDRSNFQQTVDGLRRHGGYLLDVPETDHDDFSDRALLPSVRRTGLGPIDGRRVHRVLSTYVTAFLDRYVMGGTGGLPAALDPAVRLIVFRARS